MRFAYFMPQIKGVFAHIYSNLGPSLCGKVSINTQDMVPIPRTRIEAKGAHCKTCVRRFNTIIREEDQCRGQSATATQDRETTGPET